MKVRKNSNSVFTILILFLSLAATPAGAADNLSRLRVDGHRIVSANAAAADFDGGGQVDLADFLKFADAFGSQAVEFDLDNSGTVDFADFLAFANAFGQRVDVVLRGVAVIDPFFLHAATRRGTEALNLLADEWNVDVIRVPIHPGLWQRYRDYLPAFVDPIVDWGQRRGIYIFLGWHAHGNPLTGQTEHPEWGYDHPWRGNPYNPDLSLAIEALDVIARRYSDLPHVIYGTFNEPAFIAWDDWRPVADSLVDVVHGVEPRALVLVSGVDWGYDLSGALDNPVNRPNVVYETHPYPWKGESWKSVLSDLDKTEAVFLGEWGYGHSEDPGRIRQDYGLPLIDFCQTRSIGWTAWIWHDEWTPSMLTSFRTFETTDFGEFVKRVLNNGQ
ncbi:MAG: cellulase family glycosylhydrolase [Candidatus Latescibacteria bacterium]|nr:cellulase family glycosylhydrolase [Candidatus Latescibacterota bacterium]